MRFFYSFLLLLSMTTAFSQNQRCFSYDAAGNRVTRVSGTCSAPSGLVAQPGGDLTDQADAQVMAAKIETKGQGTIADPETGGLAYPAMLQGMVCPNPTFGKFTIAFEEQPQQKQLVLELFDATGRLIERQITYDRTVGFDLSGQSPGPYFLFARQVGQARKSWKVVKQ